jgi:hypothetical protein
VVTKCEPWRNLTTLLKFRAMGAYSLEEYRTLISDAPAGTMFKLCAALVALIPGRLANMLGVIYYGALRPHSKLAIVDMQTSKYYVPLAPRLPWLHRPITA